MRDGIYPSTCWECSTTCGSLVTVRGGKVAKIGPNPDHPVSRGAFCVKGIRALPEWTDQADRILHPMRRTGPRGGGGWQRIGWDEALDEMAERLVEVREMHGPLALAGAVSGAFFSRGAVVALLMRSMGSPNWLINQDLCGGCRGVSDRITGLAMTGGEDIERTNCALIVGRNPQAADPTQWLALKRAKARGARLIVIDPVRTPAARIADLWLCPRPGTDAALALAMAHVLIDEARYDREFVDRWCHGFEALAQRAEDYAPAVVAETTGVPAEQIIAAARMYADGPSTFVSGHGIDAFSAGVQTFRAFHCLVAISGNLDRPGGNLRIKKPHGFRTPMDLLHDPAFRLPDDVARQALGADRFPLWAGPAGWQTACHNPTVIEAVLTGKPYPVRAMYVSGVNIAVTYPDSRRTVAALRALDFLAVAAHTMTPTAALADIVLPKTTTLEEEEVSLQPAGPVVTYTNPVLPPRGEARCDLAIAVDLIARLAARGAIDKNLLPWPDQRAFNAFLLGKSGITVAQLAAVGYAAFPHTRGDFAASGFATSTGKIELYSETLSRLDLDPLPVCAPPQAVEADSDFPLVLLTGAREKTYHHSRFREQAWARKVSPVPTLRIRPDTAAAMGIADDDWVEVEVRGGPGTCRLRAALTEDVPVGVVSTGMGWWSPEAPGPEHGVFDININAAVSYDGPWDPVSGSADTRGLRCRVTKLADQRAAG